MPASLRVALGSLKSCKIPEVMWRDCRVMEDMLTQLQQSRPGTPEGDVFASLMVY